MKYLIVDDDRDIRELIKHEVCLDVDEILECEDGDDALTIYTMHLPDYVLMDIEMKVINGITATKEICKHFPDARVIVLTEDDTPAFRKAAEKAGAVAFFSKENLMEVKEFILNEIMKQANHN